MSQIERKAEIAYQSLVVPLDALLLVGVGVGVTLDRTGLTAPEAVQSRADLVAAVLVDGVALSATGLEEVGTLLEITYIAEVSEICSHAVCCFHALLRQEIPKKNRQGVSALETNVSREQNSLTDGGRSSPAAN